MTQVSSKRDSELSDKKTEYLLTLQKWRAISKHLVHSIYILILNHNCVFVLESFCLFIVPKNADIL